MSKLKDYLKRGGERILDRYSRTWLYPFLTPGNFTVRRAIVKAALKHARGNALDAGSGRGPYRDLLGAMGARVFTMDRESRGNEIPDYMGDIQTLEMGRKFDTILCSQVLEHLPHPQRALENLAAHLEPEGRLIVTVPHLSMLHNEPDDYFRYTDHGLRVLLEEAGLEVIEIQKIGGLFTFLGHLYVTFLNNLLYDIPILGEIAIRLNAVSTLLFVGMDRIIGFRGLVPCNLLAIARKIEE